MGRRPSDADRDGRAASDARLAQVTLEQLVTDDDELVADAVERAAALGWNLRRPTAVLLASVDPPIDERVDTAVATIAAAARATLGPDAIVWARTSSVAALIAPAGPEPLERRRLADRLRSELDRQVRTVTVSIGVGRSVDTPEQLHASYVEARRAVAVGRWAAGRHATEVFDQLGLERLLAATPDTELAGFVEHAIGPLFEHDRLHRGELAATLEAWLSTRNVAEAARRMHVHYNTMKNRLDRIEAVLGAPLTDPQRTLEWAVALYISSRYDGPWARSS